LALEKYRIAFLGIAGKLHVLSLYTCMFLLAMLFVSQFAVVLLRYLFAIGFVQLQDFVLYCFAALSILGIPVALRLDKHVRVDIFRKSGATKRARRTDQFSYIVLLLPLFVVTFIHAMPLVTFSWQIQEGARETGGLGGYFIIMTVLPVVCVLTIIQALALFWDKSLIHDDKVN
jgi:TRAP-type mannitol/chloroaromatic compound transport system permease small subunit